MLTNDAGETLIFKSPGPNSMWSYRNITPRKFIVKQEAQGPYHSPEQ